LHEHLVYFTNVGCKLEGSVYQVRFE